ncbi:hypothetical protein J6590_083524 [Homalodisca vitripennis]|nr:hypothetical protein J6590_083524 [Homalodisca vitripennis]
MAHRTSALGTQEHLSCHDGTSHLSLEHRNTSVANMYDNVFLTVMTVGVVVAMWCFFYSDGTSHLSLGTQEHLSCQYV